MVLDVGGPDGFDRGWGGAGDAVVTKTRFTPVDAARIALAAPPVPLTASQRRVLLASATLWCHQLQFPTVREIAAAIGRTSPSTVLFGFRHLIDVHAAVIATEWRRIETGVSSSGEPGDWLAWVGRHAEELAAVDRACLRLPALVSTAVASTGRSSPVHHMELAGPLHALAALVDRPGGSSPSGVRRALLEAAAMWTCVHDVRVPA